MPMLHIGTSNPTDKIQKDYIMGSKDEWKSCVLKIVGKKKTTHYLNGTYT